MANADRNIEYTSPEIEAYYREHRTRWEHFYPSERTVFEKLGLDASSTVLDVGCGCGGLGLALHERFGVEHYTGIDINRQAAESAKTVNPRGRFLCGDILALAPEELITASFDAVVSLGCIDWNVQFAEMLAQAYRYVKPGGHFVSSFRLTPGESQMDVRNSYQYINFEGKAQGEVAPYVVLNIGALMKYLRALSPAHIRGFGYWGKPSPTARTPFDQVVFAVVAVGKRSGAQQDTAVDLDLPRELLAAAT